MYGMFWILSLFANPEAQRDPYQWASVAMAHAWLGFGAAAFLSAITGPLSAAVVASLAYALIWELFQALRSGLWWDSALDWAAWSIGCAALLWPAPAGAASLIVVAIGVWRRNGNR